MSCWEGKAHREVLISTDLRSAGQPKGVGLAGCIGCTRTRYVELPWRAPYPPLPGTVLPDWARPDPPHPVAPATRWPATTTVTATPNRRSPMRQRLFGFLLLLLAVALFTTPVWVLAVVPAGAALVLAMTAGRGKASTVGRGNATTRR